MRLFLSSALTETFIISRLSHKTPLNDEFDKISLAKSVLFTTVSFSNELVNPKIIMGT